MTAQGKDAAKPPLRRVVAMANRVASLATSQALAVMASLVAMVDETVRVKVLRRVAHVWAMWLSVRNVMRWNLRKMHCVAWPRRPTVKC